MAEGVPTNNHRGRRSLTFRLCEGSDKARHVVPTALLVRVLSFRKGLCEAVEGPNTRLLDDQWVILSSSSKSFNYFRTRRDEIRCVFDPPYFVNYITVDDRVKHSLRFCHRSDGRHGFEKIFQVVLCPTQLSQ